MIPTDLAARLKLMLESSVQPLHAARDIPPDLPAFNRGLHFSAKVLAVLEDGTYQAAVGSAKLTLSLPQAAAPGDTLDLVVVDRTAKTIIANLATPESPSLAREGAPVLSRAGLLISALLGSAANEPQPAPLGAGQPVLPAPPTGAGEAAPLLRRALAESGMFYESQQAKWLAGELPVEQLLRQPQGRLSASAEAAQAIAAQSDAEPAPGAAATRSAPSLAPNGGVAADLAPLVRQQLEALATQSVAWSGQIWPGQTLDWEIEAPPRDHDGEPENAAQHWRTQLRLTLPRLGEISAELALAPHGVSIALAVPAPNTADDLRRAETALAGALAAVGIPLRGMKVERHEPA